MAILASDIRLLKSERMTDFDDAGGYPSGDPVLDNIDNNVFPDVASGDRIGGRTHLRKIHAAVRSGDTDVYMASRVFVASLPTDPFVTVGLLVTGTSSDTKEEALDALYTEAQPDINTNLRLFQDYHEGETMISVYHFTNQVAPFNGFSNMGVGRIILLEDDANNASQYVKVTSLSYSVISNNYQTATITFSPPLRATFAGGFNDDVDYLTPTQIYKTRAVPMAYGIYGITPLSIPASEGAIDVKVDTLDVPVAPTLYEVKDASVKPSSVPVQQSQTVAMVEGRVQSATINPMPALSTISVEFLYYYAGHLITQSYNGLNHGEMFTVSGTSISILLPSDRSISLEKIGAGTSHFVDALSTDGFTLASVEDGIVESTVILQMYSSPFRLGTWYGNFQDNGAGVFSGTLSNYSSITFTGTINYTTGEIDLTFSASVSLYIDVINYRYNSTWQKIVWRYGDPVSLATQFSMLLSPDLVPTSLTIIANANDDNELFTVTDNGAGVLAGDATGTINYQTGLLAMTYAENVKVESVLAAYQYTSPSTINQVAGGTLDTVRLPASKSFPLVRIGDQVIIHHPMNETLPNPAVAETTYTLDRANVDQIWLESADGTRIPTTKYTVNLVSGSVTMAAGLDLSGYQQPLNAWTSIHTEALATNVNTDTRTVRLSRGLRHAYPGQTAYLSSQVPCGDLSASITVPFSQQAWTSVWQNTLIGDAITPQFNASVYPIVVSNDGAITERWRIQFTGTTTVNIIGEKVGQIATALSITADIAPINPYTSQPYFTIPNEGWGAGWVNGNLLRFNTHGADYPLWAVRVVQPSDHEEGVSDRFRLTFIGDVDA